MAQTERKRARQVGRRTRAKPLSEEAPGWILLLALIGALPVVVIFIIGLPLTARDAVHPLEVWPTWRNLFYVVTPAASALALWYHRKAPGWVKDHNAARIGRKVALASLVCWALFGVLYVWLFVL